MFVYQTKNPVVIKLFSYEKTFFCSKKFAQRPTKWLKTIYISHSAIHDLFQQRRLIFST